MDSTRTPRSGPFFDDASTSFADYGQRSSAPAPDPIAEESVAERTLRIARSRKWIILQATILIPLIALVLSLTQQKAYTATSTLLFKSTNQTSGSVDVNRQAATNQQLVSLPAVARRAAAALHISEQDVHDNVSIQPNGQSDLVNVSATAPSRAEAVRLANGYAQAFVTFRANAQLADVRSRLGVYDTILKTLPASEQNSARADTLRRRLDQLQVQQELQSATAGRTVELVQPADLPTSPSAPKTKRNVAIGIVLGMLIGFALAALLERIDRRVKETDELERLFGAPLLARIPRIRGVARRFGQGSRVTLPATGADIEAFRSLRASLRYYSVGRSLNSLLITSPAPEDGKSTVARGLATTMAQMGDNVVLVETDLRKGDGRSGFSAGDAIGLSGVLVGDDLDTALHYVSIDGRDGEERQLAVLPSGPNPPNPSQLLESRRMAEVLEELTHRYDVVVLDSPPLTAVSDALALIHETSGVIVVGRLRHSTRDASLDLRKQLAMTNAPVLGVVANFAPVKTSGYYSGS